jgi:Spy/CpxP family protein refolding chaperone
MRAFATALTLACAVALPAGAQAPQPAAPAPAYTVDSVRKAALADKRGLVAKNMTLTEAEAKKFWPIYDSYQAKLGEITQRQNRVVLDYVNAGESITEGNAKRLTKELIEADAAEQKLRESTMKKVMSALPPRKAARYMQIENKIRAIHRLDLAERVPLVP